MPGEVRRSGLKLPRQSDSLIHVIPTLSGAGIPLLAPQHRNVELRLHSCTPHEDGVVRLHHAVVRQRPPEAGGARQVADAPES